MRKARQREFKMAWQALKETLPSGDFSPFLNQFSKKASADHTTSLPASGATELGVDDASAALLLRDNLTHRHDIERAYLKAIGVARHDIVIANAYFVPGRKLRRALTLAAQRGVRVRLLVQGRYENFFQFHSARPVHQTLVAAGIEIREYAPSALHAKVAVVDQRWATVGSTNLDPLSLLLAREANVSTTDERFAAMLYQRLDTLMRESGQAIDPASLTQRSIGQRILDRLAFALMRVLLFVTGHRY